MKVELVIEEAPAVELEIEETIKPGGIIPVGTLPINTNGTHDVTQYAAAEVDVPNTYTAEDEGKVVDNGALISQTQKSISANGTHDTTVNDEVVVNVPNSYTAADEGKVVDGGALVEQTAKAIGANGTHDTTTNNAVVVDVPNSYTAEDEGKVVDNGVLVDQTARAIGENGTYDTTTNDEVTVDVPNPSTGTKNITENGTYDVTEFASADVAVPNPSSGSISITANGTYDVTEKASAVVDVPQGDEWEVVTLYEGSETSWAYGDKLLYPVGVNPTDFEYLRVTLYVYSGKTVTFIITPSSVENNFANRCFVGTSAYTRGINYVSMTNGRYYMGSNTNAVKLKDTSTDAPTATVDNTACIPRKIEGIRKKTS